MQLHAQMQTRAPHSGWRAGTPTWLGRHRGKVPPLGHAAEGGVGVTAAAVVRPRQCKGGGHLQLLRQAGRHPSALPAHGAGASIASSLGFCCWATTTPLAGCTQGAGRAVVRNEARLLRQTRQRRQTCALPTAPCISLYPPQVSVPSAAHLPRANGLLVNSACTHGERMGTRAVNASTAECAQTLECNMLTPDTSPGVNNSCAASPEVCNPCTAAPHALAQRLCQPPPVPQCSPPAVGAGNGASAAPASVTAPSCCSARPRLGCCCGCCECEAAATARSAASSAASSAGRRCALLHPMGVLQVRRAINARGRGGRGGGGGVEGEALLPRLRSPLLPSMEVCWVPGHHSPAIKASDSKLAGEPRAHSNTRCAPACRRQRAAAPASS